MSSKTIDPTIAVSHVLMSKNSSIGSALKSAPARNPPMQCSGDADQGRDDEASGIVTWQESLGERPGQEPEDDECDDSHWFLLFESTRIPAAGHEKTNPAAVHVVSLSRDGPGRPKQARAARLLTR